MTLSPLEHESRAMQKALKAEREALGLARLRLWPSLHQAAESMEIAEGCLGCIQRLDWMDGVDLARVEDAAKRMLASVERMRKRNAA